MKIFWFIPTHGDSRYLGTSKGARVVDHAYMKQIAVAVDNLGYEGVLIPTGRSCEDPWLTAASLIDATKIKIPGGIASRRDHAGTGCTYGRDL